MDIAECTAGSPAIADPRAPAPDEPLDNRFESRNATHETFLDRQIIFGHHHFFAPANPSDVDGNRWLRAWRSAAVLPILTQAFQQGRRVRLQLGFPHTSPPDGGKTATVRFADIEFQPTQLAAAPLADIPEAEEDFVHEGQLRSSRTHFAVKSTLRRSDGELYGAWRDSFHRACEGAPRITSIPEQAILELFDAGECQGKTVTLCTHF